jgi:hypothetical protein
MRRKQWLLMAHDDSKRNILFCDYTTSTEKVEAWQRLPMIPLGMPNTKAITRLLSASPLRDHISFIATPHVGPQLIKPINVLGMEWNSRAKSWQIFRLPNISQNT